MVENEKIIVAYHRVSPTKHDRISTDGLKLSQKDIKENLHKSMVSSMDLAERHAKLNGEEIHHHYCDEYVSGKDQKNQIEFQKMMQDCRKGLIKKIYIRRVNRFGRNRNHAMDSMVELDKLGVSIVFIENGIDTSKPFMQAIMLMFVELAEQEREFWEIARIEGIEKARLKGVKFGQPEKKVNIKMLRTERLKPPAERSTWKQLEEDFGCSRTTLIRKLKQAGYWDNERRCAI